VQGGIRLFCEFFIMLRVALQQLNKLRPADPGPPGPDIGHRRQAFHACGEMSRRTAAKAVPAAKVITIGNSSFFASTV
jgi:hypothetical protein